MHLTWIAIMSFEKFISPLFLRKLSFCARVRRFSGFELASISCAKRKLFVIEILNLSHNSNMFYHPVILSMFIMRFWSCWNWFDDNCCYCCKRVAYLKYLTFHKKKTQPQTVSNRNHQKWSNKNYVMMECHLHYVTAKQTIQNNNGSAVA